MNTKPTLRTRWIVAVLLAAALMLVVRVLSGRGMREDLWIGYAELVAKVLGAVVFYQVVIRGLAKFFKGDTDDRSGQ